MIDGLMMILLVTKNALKGVMKEKAEKEIERWKEKGRRRGDNGEKEERRRAREMLVRWN